ncbi:hypothetical protein HDU90_005889 [Geranomyces variabilis]|nr:hypothetical protein HDU90_005889 [Geranomyces variabilis]
MIVSLHIFASRFSASSRRFHPYLLCSGSPFFCLDAPEFARPVLSAGAAKPLVTSQGGRKTRKTANKRVVSEKQTTGKGPVSDNPAAAAPQKCQSKLAESETSKAAVLERFSALHGNGPAGNKVILPHPPLIHTQSLSQPPLILRQGCGPKTALKWYHEYGYRTLDDLRTSDKLTHNQKVGVRFYDDLRQKMPRAEAEAIGAYVEKAAKSFDSGYQCHIMVTHPDGRSHDGLVPKLLAELERVPGLLVEHLQCRSAASGYEDCEQYMGICRLPGGPGIHRRLDIWAVPWDEIGAALVHWTGNTIFNMRLRQLAAKKGMRLSQHGLFAIHDTTRDARTPRAKDLADGLSLIERCDGQAYDIDHQRDEIFEPVVSEAQVL